MGAYSIPAVYLPFQRPASWLWPAAVASHKPTLLLLVCFQELLITELSLSHVSLDRVSISVTECMRSQTRNTLASCKKIAVPCFPAKYIFLSPVTSSVLALFHHTWFPCCSQNGAFLSREFRTGITWEMINFSTSFPLSNSSQDCDLKGRFSLWEQTGTSFQMSSSVKSHTSPKCF